MKNCFYCCEPTEREPEAIICWSCEKQRGILQRKAYYIVREEIRKGRLPRVNTLRCVDCGLPARRYDHRDYSKPLDIEPVCNGCNIRRGPANFSPKPAVSLLPDSTGRQVPYPSGVCISAPEGVL